MKIKLEAQDVSKKLYLREELATATLPDGLKVEVCHVIGSGALHVKIGDKAFLITLEDIVDEILAEMQAGE